MDQKIIFRKTYPRIEELLKEIETEEDALPEENEDLDSLANFLKQKTEERVYVLMPDRIERQESFINAAIALSEFYQIDLIVVESVDRITAEFTLECTESVPKIKTLIQMADDIIFTCGPRAGEMQIGLDYYTHAIYRNGKRIR